MYRTSFSATKVITPFSLTGSLTLVPSEPTILTKASGIGTNFLAVFFFLDAEVEDFDEELAVFAFVEEDLLSAVLAVV